MENREVARVLRETAQLLEIDGALIGRYRSYEKTAELIASLAESIEAGGLGFSSSQSRTHSDGDGNPISSRGGVRDCPVG